MDDTAAFARSAAGATTNAPTAAAASNVKYPIGTKVEKVNDTYVY